MFSHQGFAISHDASSFKKVAVLTGLTMLVGGAEISEAEAATLVQTDDMPVISTGGPGTQSSSATVNFDQFNTALGTLTDVQFSLTSNISTFVEAENFTPTISAQVKVDSVQIGPTGTAAGTFDFGPVEGVLSPPALSFYEGSSTFGVLLTLDVISAAEVYVGATWDNLDAVTVTYTYTASATPLPAALPLFTTGLAGLGFTTWRGRRKQKTTKQA